MWYRLAYFYLRAKLFGILSDIGLHAATAASRSRRTTYKKSGKADCITTLLTEKKLGSRDILGSSKSSLFTDAGQKACIFSTTRKPTRPLLESTLKQSNIKFLETSRKFYIKTFKKTIAKFQKGIIHHWFTKVPCKTFFVESSCCLQAPDPTHLQVEFQKKNSLNGAIAPSELTWNAP